MSRKRLLEEFDTFNAIASEDSRSNYSKSSRQRASSTRFDIGKATAISPSRSAFHLSSCSQLDVGSNGSQCHFECKIFNDPVHNTIKMEGICLKIVDTFEFQRLHMLKQLGVCDFVFRGATHTRFSHSLGVAYLAERVARGLKEAQPELDITEIDILCVKIAGNHVLHFFFFFLYHVSFPSPPPSDVN